MFSGGLARRHLAWHLSNGRLPFALACLEEASAVAVGSEGCAEGSVVAEGGREEEEEEGDAMGWDMYVEECAHYSRVEGGGG
jgi:hypothetical protein